jgi:hypothetical protein
MGKQTKRPPKGAKPVSKTLRQQLQQQGLFKDDLMRLEETEGPKLSAAILELMAPYADSAATRAGFEQLATLAVVAWNAALLEPEEREALLAAAVKAVVATAGAQWRPAVTERLAGLVQRKLDRFPADRRFVVDYRVTESAKEYRLAVAVLAKRGQEPAEENGAEG